MILPIRNGCVFFVATKRKFTMFANFAAIPPGTSNFGRATGSKFHRAFSKAPPSLVRGNEFAVTPGVSQSGIKRQRHRDPDQDRTRFVPRMRPPCRFFMGIMQFE